MTQEPWYARTLRWGQTNLVEIDPERYDHTFWREHWRKTRIQGVIVNAGGIVAYYPSRFPLHHRAERLGDRDLYGEIVIAAREEGLAVVARMDSNRVAADFAAEHPEWLCRDASGNPLRVADKFITCIGSEYYSDYLPRVMEEIIERSSPDGFSDNSWAGLPRKTICYCDNCASQFRARSGNALPPAADWDDPVYRDWIEWNFERRSQLWQFNNDVTTAAGGKDCRWAGMIGGDLAYNSERFVDLRSILKLTPIVMLDHQRRKPADGFEQNTDAGKRLHALLGWDKLIPESTPQYQLGGPVFRLSSMPSSEVRLWATAGFAGGIQPWWHHIGSSHEDRRQYKTAEPLFRWHEANQQYLVNRTPIADVGVVWSQQNHDFYGRNDMKSLTLAPYRGVVKALDRFGISYLPLHADDIAGALNTFKIIVLPNMGLLTDSQIEAIKAFAEAGGTVVATGSTSVAGPGGVARPEPALAAFFGLRFGTQAHGGMDDASNDIETHARHSYLRLTPEVRAGLYGPADDTAPREAGARHALLAGFEETDTLPFGGYLPVVETLDGTATLATFIPDFPIFPPETAWMRTPKTDIPAITVRELANGGKLVWFVGDVDRCFARDDQLEHARLFTNAVAWATDGKPCIALSGTHGVVTATPYQQGNSTIVHLNNRLALSQVSGRQYDLIPIGPVELTLPVPPERTAGDAALRVAGTKVPGRDNGDGTFSWTIESVADHELAVIEWR